MRDGRRAHVFIEIAGGRPRAFAFWRDAITPFRDVLIGNQNLFVPTFHHFVTLETRHHLIERCAALNCPESRDGLSNYAPRLLSGKQRAENEELQVGENGEIGRSGHNVGLGTIGWTPRSWKGLEGHTSHAELLEAQDARPDTAAPTVTRNAAV
jgi:hypothetical protein